jgi:hypothetical protein
MVVVDGAGGFVSARLPWISQDVIAVSGAQHDLPKSPEKFLAKFDLEKKNDTPEVHFKKFMLSL